VTNSTASSTQRLSFTTLDQVFGEQLDLRPIKFIKTDIEGYDLKAIRGAARTISQFHPVLFFEYNVSGMERINEDGAQFFRWLADRGYKKALLWDDMGRFLLSASLDDVNLLKDMTEYASRGKGLIPYYDIGAFHESDLDLFGSSESVERRHRLEVSMS